MPEPNAQASSSKHKSKKDKSHSHKKDKSHKHKENSSHHVTASSSSSKSDKSPFEHRLSSMRLSIPPKFSIDMMEGVREKLDGMIMRYVSQMGGVLLAHWDHCFIDDSSKIINECPSGVIEVEFHSILWAPKIGQKLYGTHSLSSPSHLSLLFSKTFNVSIPLHHIPTDLYEFEHTDEAADSDSEDEEEEGFILGNGIVEDVGRWKEKSTGKSLGDGGKGIKFTVIGMQVTNQMLSLTGSLLSDPWNAPPPAETTLTLPSRVSPSPSPSPEPTRPVKQPRLANNKAAAYQAASAPAYEEEEVDTTGWTARQLKQHRKEMDKKKRDAKKARKADKVLEEVQAEAGGDLVGIQGREEAVGTKRKAGEGDGDIRKKKKGDQ
ncbi:uncharacterized protein I303_100763 [Kwoniella dejecticola CBS 10117]|uniref:RPA43 OB domain-containing protein n=1 Tax=Kwoniella dejecticola CBS 10117 TaxID=1296121 RepID=A0A1A6AFV0_9TREE|nr:uncharacterized protein I303_00765 [Kwoniella dejecticola CBS 10117]OBR88945.1 hypothetical protein I303_00765 [Kwoniella dejecticola CBS 10117]